MSAFISIICPIRNEARYIEKSLNSLLAQDVDLERIEILVVDGMSSDGTRAIVESMCRKHPQIRMLDNPRRTAPYAMNIGLRAARGDIIVRVDGHAYLSSNYLRECETQLAATAADCVGGVIKSVTDNETGRAIAAAMSSVFGVGNARFRTSGEAGYVDTLAFGAYRKNVFERIGMFDEQLTRCQDDEFNYRMIKSGMKIYFHPSIVSYYYPRQSLQSLWKQYFGYGMWKVRVLQKHMSVMRVRQFVPFLFVSSLLASAIAGCFNPVGLIPGAAILALYTSASLFFSFQLARQEKAQWHVRLPLVFYILHASYGFGFLIGLFRFGSWFIRKEPDLRSNLVEVKHAI
jgi:glycosyltransferase involved in cell wall biosynthesis